MPQCTATSKQSGQQCKRSAVAGYSVCASHGARGGAPLGNKNALKTGEYETIWLDQLEADERALLPRIQLDPLSLLDDEIRLATIRERRMLARIASLASAEDGLTIVRIGVEHKEGVDAGDEDDSGGATFETKTATIREGALGQIQDIEHALTRVQQAKTRLIELRAKLSTGDGSDDALADLVAVISRSRQEIERRREAVADGE